jgi:hypothetical protein
MDPIEERRFVDRMKRLATSPEQVRLCEIAERSIIKECLEARGVDPAPYVSQLGKPVTPSHVTNVTKVVDATIVTSEERKPLTSAERMARLRARRAEEEG